MNGKAALMSGLVAVSIIGSHGANASEVVEYVLNDGGFVLHDGPDPYDVPIPVCIKGNLVWPESYSPPYPPPVTCEQTTPVAVWFMLVMGAAGGVITAVFFARKRFGKRVAVGRG